MMNEPTRILVVDSNKVYAKAVKGVLEKNIPDAKVSVASNIHELNRRLSSSDFKLVLADLSVPNDAETMLARLEDLDSTVVCWSAIKHKSDSSLRFVKKPTSQMELTRLSAFASDLLPNGKVKQGATRG
jgi:DNA-binding NtrC family response regulator